MKFKEFESRQDWKDRTCRIWINMDAIMCIMEYPKYYKIRMAEGYTHVDKTEHNRKIFQDYGVKVHE